MKNPTMDSLISFEDFESKRNNIRHLILTEFV